jgi:hypothetical protein
MIIRDSQFEVFEKNAWASFIDELVSRVGRAAPRLAAVAMGPGVRSFVVQNAAEARRFGFTKREPIRFFVETAVVLGHGFATDPQYPWAHAIVTGPDTEDVRADFLCRHLFDYLHEVSGPDSVFAQRALQRFEEVLPPTTPVDALPDRDQALRLMRQCYPEKLEYVGQHQFRLLWDRAAETAAGFALQQRHAASVLALLMVAFGHGIAINPLYPWVSASMSDSAIADPQARLERLYDRTRRYLRHVLTHLGKT